MNKATATSAQEATPQKHNLGSITGHITIQNKLAPGIELELYLRQYPLDKAIAATKTDANGRYQFIGLPANHYWLKILSQKYFTEGQTPVDGPGRTIRVADNEAVEDADLDLLPCGVVSGRVTDSAGSPVIGQEVWLTAVSERGVSPNPIYLQSDPYKTDGNGSFRMFGVPPGSYLVSIGVDIARLRGDVRDRSDDGSVPLFGHVYGNYYYEQTFYPGVTDQQQAYSVKVPAGGEVTGINMSVGRAYPAYAVSGRVIDARTGKPVVNCGIGVMQRVGSGYRGMGAWETDENGAFHISWLIPGRFFITTSLDKTDTDLYGSNVDFEIKGADISGLEIKAYPGHSLEGTVVIEGEKSSFAVSQLSKLGISADYSWAGGSMDTSRNVSVGQDGSFRIRGLQPGDLKLSLSTFMDDYFSITRLEFPKPADKTQAKIIAATPHGEIPLQMGDQDLKGARIIVTYKSASIKGHVNIAGGRLPADISLWAAINLNKRNGVSRSSGAGVDANGDFIIEGLEPGGYEIWIIDGPKIYTDIKIIKVNPHAQTKITFTIDPLGKPER